MQLKEPTIPQIVNLHQEITQLVSDILADYDCYLHYEPSTSNTPTVYVEDTELFTELPYESESVVNEGIVKELLGVNYLLPNRAFEDLDAAEEEL